MKTKYLILALGFFAAAMIGITTVKLISPTIDWDLETEELDKSMVDNCTC